ncbi:hypothetical protein TWF696_002367 [Orbilia brochopaga]|uniref:Uncharacterized protein n=1 Tax=Orbilia brochopaga TaxID=3140254 RepID=A0AAV9U4K5_9PEZI
MRGIGAMLPMRYSGLTASPYEVLQDHRWIQMFIREVLETAVNPQARVQQNSGPLMENINWLAGIDGNQLYLPPVEPGTDLRLDQELLDVGYELPAEDEAATDEDLDQEDQQDEEASPLNDFQEEQQDEASPLIDLVEENAGDGAPEATLNNNLERNILPDGTVRYTVQLPTGDVLEFINGRGRVIPATQENNPMVAEEIPVEYPNYPPTQEVTTDMAEALQVALDSILERPIWQSDIPSPATAIIDGLVLPTDGIRELWDDEPEKDGFYAALEDRVKDNMGALLVARDIFRRFEEGRLNLPLGTLGLPNLEYAGIDAVDHLVTLGRSFQDAEDKIVWYKMQELMQQWNIATFRFVRQLYADYAAEREAMERDPPGFVRDDVVVQGQNRIDIPGLTDPNGGMAVEPFGSQNVPQFYPELQQQVSSRNRPAQNLYEFASRLTPFQMHDLLSFEPQLINEMADRRNPLTNPFENPTAPRTRNRGRRPLPSPSDLAEDEEEEENTYSEMERVVAELSDHSSDFETPTGSDSQEADDYTPGSGGTSTVVNDNEDVESDDGDFETRYFEELNRQRRRQRYYQGD